MMEAGIFLLLLVIGIGTLQLAKNITDLAGFRRKNGSKATRAGNNKRPRSDWYVFFDCSSLVAPKSLTHQKKVLSTGPEKSERPFGKRIVPASKRQRPRLNVR